MPALLRCSLELARGRGSCLLLFGLLLLAHLHAHNHISYTRTRARARAHTERERARVCVCERESFLAHLCSLPSLLHRCVQLLCGHFDHFAYISQLQ